MIVKSILDTDLYKFTTSYAYMKLFPQARGTFEFFDRDLTEYPEDFVQKVYLELSNLGMLRLTNSELDYMTSNCRFVPQVYWEWLYSFRFKPANIVMKLISCQMNANQPVYGCVKLSDDAGKHTGENKEVNACLVELGL